MHRSRTVTALVAAGLALGAAGPASAAPNAGATVVPTDKNGKRSCVVAISKEGDVTYVPHGTVRTTKSDSGTTYKQKCTDGTWVSMLWLSGSGTPQAPAYEYSTP